MDDQEFTTGVLYQLAYRIAADRAKASRFDTLYGRCHQAKDGAAEAIEAEVINRVGRPEPMRSRWEIIARFGRSELAVLETIREAIADALAGRRPRW